MPTMPNVVGMDLQEATAALESAGVLVPSSIGYFGTWPITASWVAGSADSAGTVTAQSPASEAQIAANGAVTLTLAEFPVGVVYP